MHHIFLHTSHFQYLSENINIEGTDRSINKIRLHAMWTHGLTSDLPDIHCRYLFFACHTHTLWSRLHAHERTLALFMRSRWPSVGRSSNSRVLYSLSSNSSTYFWNIQFDGFIQIQDIYHMINITCGLYPPC